MSSQENHLNSGEVVVSPEPQGSVETAAHKDTAEPVDPQLQAQPEEAVAPPPDTDETTAVEPLSVDADEPSAQPEAAAVEASAEEPSETEPPAESTDAPEEEDTLEMADVASLMESMEAAPSLTVGEIVQGHIVNVAGEEVLVDLGLKCEAVIPRNEFLSENGELPANEFLSARK